MPFRFNISPPRRLIELSKVSSTTSRTLAENSRTPGKIGANCTHLLYPIAVPSGSGQLHSCRCRIWPMFKRMKRLNGWQRIPALNGFAAHSLFSLSSILRGMELFTQLFGSLLASSITVLTGL